MKQIFKDKSFLLSVILTFIFFGAGITFLFLGWSDYSPVLFILLPALLGIAIGALPYRKYVIYGSLIASVIFLTGLYIPALSGLLCIIMALPIIVPMILLGYFISLWVKRRKKIKDTDKLSVLLFPLIPFLIAAPIEHFLKKEKEAVMGSPHREGFQLYYRAGI